MPFSGLPFATSISHLQQILALIFSLKPSLFFHLSLLFDSKLQCQIKTCSHHVILYQNNFRSAAKTQTQGQPYPGQKLKTNPQEGLVLCFVLFFLILILICE